MKTFVVLLVLVFVISAFGQSDCGNCWIVGGGCDPTGSVTCAPYCQICMYFVDCDNHDCAYNTGWFCNCPPGIAGQPKPDCLMKKAEVVEHNAVKKAQIFSRSVVFSMTKGKAKPRG